jgi:hypothetical protein
MLRIGVSQKRSETIAFATAELTPTVVVARLEKSPSLTFSSMASMQQPQDEATPFTVTRTKSAEVTSKPHSVTHAHPLQRSATILLKVQETRQGGGIENVLTSVVPDKTAAVAVSVATSSVSAVAGAITDPTQPSQVARSLAMLQLLTCGLNEEGTEEPSVLAFPAQPPVGGGPARFYLGGMICNTVLMICAFLVLALLRRRIWQHYEGGQLKAASGAAEFRLLTHDNNETCSLGEESWKPRTTTQKIQRNLAAPFCAVVMAYFAPVTCGGGVHVLARWYGDPLSALVSILSLVVCLALLTLIIFHLSSRDEFGASVQILEPPAAIHRGPTRTKQALFGPIADSGKSISFLHTFVIFFDNVRSVRILPVRLLYVEDVLVSCLVSMLSAIPARTTAGCTALAALVACLVLLHGGYLLYYRPYQARLEFAFACLNVTSFIALSVCVIGSLHSPGKFATPLGLVSLVNQSLFFIQGPILLYWSYAVRSRREYNARVRTDDRAAAAPSSAAAMSLPVLATPMMNNDHEMELQAFNPLRMDIGQDPYERKPPHDQHNVLQVPINHGGSSPINGQRN